VLLVEEFDGKLGVAEGFLVPGWREGYLVR
jgi:hypothetical protein